MKVQRNRPKKYAKHKVYNSCEIHDGLTIPQWAAQLGITPSSFRWRIRNWGFTAASTQDRSTKRHKAQEHHGLSKTQEYFIWGSMITRCRNENHPQWKDYGGRGIEVCTEWQESFVQFLADVGKRPKKGLTLERLDNDGDYEPGNVAWVSRTENQQNARSNHNLTAFGKTQCLAEWCREYDITPASLVYRLDAGLTVEEALTQPKRRGKPLC